MGHLHTKIRSTSAAAADTALSQETLTSEGCFLLCGLEQFLDLSEHYILQLEDAGTDHGRLSIETTKRCRETFS